MDVRLVQLLGSFIGARNQYALSRLEFAMHTTEQPAPPLIGCLSDASERALRDEWPEIERELDHALNYSKHLRRLKGAQLQDEVAYRSLERTLREMDQYARAIRWVLSVTQNEDA